MEYQRAIIQQDIQIIKLQNQQQMDTSLDYDSIMFGIYYEDGSSLQIYKSKEYTNENPLINIYVRNPDGEWSKETVNAKEIDLEHCSFAEMRAATAYLWETGAITDEWTYVQLSRANEDDRTVMYDDIFYSTKLAGKSGTVDEISDRWRSICCISTICESLFSIYTLSIGKDFYVNGMK
ncbi:MAG: hypothetical protein J1E64_09095 [Acetatifactor sp.]|nr:hypothetical protein [Acetatifactor sp.]